MVDYQEYLEENKKIGIKNRENCENQMKDLIEVNRKLSIKKANKYKFYRIL